MPASQTFSGNWTIKVVSSGFFARQRFIVEGSLGAREYTRHNRD